MTGWGVWTTTGEIDASLRPLPLALLVYLPAGVMVYGALRGAFGAAPLGAERAATQGVAVHLGRIRPTGMLGIVSLDNIARP